MNYSFVDITAIFSIFHHFSLLSCRSSFGQLFPQPGKFLFMRPLGSFMKHFFSHLLFICSATICLWKKAWELFNDLLCMPTVLYPLEFFPLNLYFLAQKTLISILFSPNVRNNHDVKVKPETYEFLIVTTLHISAKSERVVKKVLDTRRFFFCK